MKKGSLTEEAVDGMAWQVLAIAANMVLRAAVLILLARTISAREFGIIAAATVVTSVANQFSQIGISRAVVQRLVLTRDHIQASSAISLYTGLAAATGIYFTAEPVSAVFRIPELVPFIRFLSLTLLFSSLAAVPGALIQRARRFRVLGLVELGSFVFGFGFVALPLALLGFGAWSLAWAYMAQVSSRMLTLHILARPKLGLWAKPQVARELIHVGYAFSLGQVGNFVALQIDYFIVGRWLGAEALGFYNRAYQFLMLPAQLFGRAASTVLLPSMSSIQDQPERVAAAFQRAIGVIAMVTIPVSGILIILAPETVHFLLGKRWDAMVAPFQILVASLLFRTSYKISDSVVQAMGSMYQRAWRQWVYAGLVASGAYAGSAYGVAGVAAGVGLAVMANFLLMFDLVRRITGLAVMPVVIVHLRHLAMSMLLVGPVWVAVHLARRAALGDLPVLLAGGGAALAAGSVLWFALRPALGDDGVWLQKLILAKLQRLRPDK